MKRYKYKHHNDCGDVVTIEWNGVEWFVDMGCPVLNRYYKRFGNAVNYVVKNGYRYPCF